jgi:hypothetical protein
VAPRKQQQATLLARHVAEIPRSPLTSEARLDEADEVAVEHDHERCRSVHALPDQLESARALPVDDLERLLRLNAPERLVGALAPRPAREVVARSIDVVPAHAAYFLFLEPVRMPRSDHLDDVPGRGKPPAQVGGVILHAADPVKRQYARDNADTHDTTVVVAA